MSTIDDIRHATASAAADFDIRKVFLFGSYARGEASPKSDIDICLETGPTFSLFSAGDFASALEHALGTRIDVSSERSLFLHVRTAMSFEKILIYER